MDSSSRSSSPQRPKHRPPSPPSPSPDSPLQISAETLPAFDNKAYLHDESDQNHNESFSSNTHIQNGHSKEANGDTKTLEAVNLELINLSPRNGNTKKNVELDMNSSNPYDEYFVPVNEHRKYMRGEKLYVTADKRGDKGGCKRPLCWTLLALVVAAVVALIVLAATGVLFSNSPTTVDEYNSTVSSARALGGIVGLEHNDAHIPDEHVHNDSEHDHANKQDPHNHTQQDQATPGSSEENLDLTKYVPNTVEGELKINNKEFTDALRNPLSDEYQDLVRTFNEALKKTLLEQGVLSDGEQDINVEVIGFSPGSLIVNYRINWKPKRETDVDSGDNKDLLSTASLTKEIKEYLYKNSGMLGTYHVADNHVTAKPVLDLCQINNNDCEYGCMFDKTKLTFVCTCPEGQEVMMINLKKCIAVEAKSKQKDYRLLESTVGTNSNMGTDRTVFDWNQTGYETHATESNKNKNDTKYSHVFGHPEEKYETTSMPEPEPKPKSELSEPKLVVEPKSYAGTESTAASETSAKQTGHQTNATEFNENENDAKYLHMFSRPEKKQKTSLVPEPEPKNIPKSMAEPEPISEPEPTAELEPESKPEPIVEHGPSTQKAATAAEPSWTENVGVPEPSAKPKLSESKLSTEPKPRTEPDLTATPEVIVKSEPSAEPEPTTEPEPTAQPDLVSKPEPKSIAKHKLSFEPEPVAEYKPISAPELAAEPEPKSELELTAEPVSKTEPESIAKSEPDQTAKPERESKQEPTAEPLPKSKPDLSAEPKPKPRAEPVPTITPETSVKSKPYAEPEPTTAPEPSSEPEPTAQPDLESKPEPKSITKNKPSFEPEPVAEYKPISAPEPTAEPEPKSEQKPTTEQDPKSEPEPTPEPVSKPKPIANPETKSEPELTQKPERESEQEATAKPEPKSEAELSAEPEIKNKPKLISEPEPQSKPEPTTEAEHKSKPKPIVEHEPTTQIAATTPEPLWTEYEEAPEPSAKSEPQSGQASTEISEPTKQDAKKVDEPSILTSEAAPKTGGSFFGLNVLEPKTKSRPELTTELQPTSVLFRANVESHPTTTEPNNKKEINYYTAHIIQNNVQTTETQPQTESSYHIVEPAPVSEYEYEEDTNRSLQVFIKPDVNSPVISRVHTTTDAGGEMDVTTLVSNVSDYHNINDNDSSATKPLFNNNNIDSNNRTHMEVMKVYTKNGNSVETEQRLFKSIQFPNEDTSSDILINENIAPLTTTTSLVEDISTTTTSNDESNNTPDNQHLSYSEIGKKVNYTENMPVETIDHNTALGNMLKLNTSVIREDLNTINNKSTESKMSHNAISETFNVVLNNSSQPTENQNKIEREETETKTEHDNEYDPMKSEWLINNEYETTEFYMEKDDEADHLDNLGVPNLQESKQIKSDMINNSNSDNFGMLRVNMESKEITNDNTKNISEISQRPEESQPDVKLPVQITTIGEYIISKSGMDSVTSPTFQPAPVWEDLDKDINALEDSTSENSVKLALSVVENSKDSKEIPQISTLGNNLNVNIYEVANHNSSLFASKNHNQATEYENQETEMNPFLPEVENNKSLVKTLQEGHDIELPNTNETQHDSISDYYAKGNVLPQHLGFGEDTTSKPETTIGQQDVPINEHQIANTSKAVPMSTFLLDTDDLDVRHTTELEQGSSTPQTDSEMISMTEPIDYKENGGYLSVVPLEYSEENKLKKKNFIINNIHGLNDISDSRKKSDRRSNNS